MIISELIEEKDGADVLVIAPDDTLIEAAGKLVNHNIGALVVTDEADNLVGIVSERDLIGAIAAQGSRLFDMSISDVMTRSVVSCTPDEAIAAVLNRMHMHQIRHAPVLDGGKLTAIISIREITREYERLQMQANTDELTGLSNRRHFLKSLEKEFDRSHRYGHPLSVMMIDIDHFKRINDTFGHDAGDEVLRVLARIIVQELRTIDTVGRLGGEEFVVMFPETAMDGARIACERLLTTIRAAKTEIDHATISFTVSAGLTTVDTATQDSAGVLKRIDELMYTAKSRGRDRLETDAPHEQRPVLEARPAGQ